MFSTMSRPDVAEWAEISLSQLDYLTRLDVVAPDIGERRKRFSPHEARLAVIAGCGLANGITPIALKGPIDWLRQHTARPKVKLPDELVDLDIEVRADRLRRVLEAERDARFVELGAASIARRIYCLELSNSAFEQSEDERTAIFAKAMNSTDKATVDALLAASARAKSMLNVPAKWDLKTIERIETFRDFELACRGLGNMFFHLVAKEDKAWRAYLHTDLVRIEREPAWLVIDLRHLFGERKLMI